MQFSRSCVICLLASVGTAARADILDVPSEFSTIQAAIDAAVNGDEVVLADGTYTGDGNRDLDFLGKTITLRSVSEDPATCILDAEGTIEDSHRVMTLANGEPPETVISGITIRGGYIYTDNGQQDPRGAGVFCSGSSPTFMNCVFRQNTCWAVSQPQTATGGALCSEAGTPMVIDCVFEGNESNHSGEDAAGGAVCGDGITLVRCTFTGNRVFGSCLGRGGAFFGTGTLIECVLTENGASGAGSCGGSGTGFGGAVCGGGTFTRCVFTENSVAGAASGTADGGAFHADRPATLIGCWFVGNFAGMAGGAVSSASDDLLVVNSLFRGNTAGAFFYAGGAAAVGAGRLVNCTIVSNESTMGGAVLGSFDVTNCILRENSPPQIGSPSTTVTYSNVQGGYVGAGNFDADPMFVDAAGGNLRLAPQSPCIDAGDNTAVPGKVDTDLDGRPRFVDDPGTPDTGVGDPPIVDMGAYEAGCDADTNGDFEVDVTDLVTVILDWDCVNPPGPCSGDVNGDGVVNVKDLLDVILAWGPCHTPVGACCLGGGSCVVVSEETCSVLSGVWLGAGVMCDAAVCGGACCLPHGVCLPVEFASCESQGGQWQGLGTTCLSNFCEGVCCLPDGSCLDLTTEDCSMEGGEWSFGLCVKTSCPPTGSCCLSDYSCVDLTSSGCASLDGSWTPGFCATSPCGACCLPSGACTPGSEPVCETLSGQWLGESSTCEECPGACCFTDGTCDELTDAVCLTQGGTLSVGLCETANCPILGACCLPGGVCQDRTEPICDVLGGKWQGAGTSCAVEGCPPP